FTYESMVGVGVLVKNFEFIVEAEMPLFYELNNPGNVLVASQTGNKIVVKSKEPLFKAIMDEESPLLDEIFKNFSGSGDWISVSSHHCLKSF
ncbi:MAG: hypothetical protein J7501_18065, partial [Bdellovibrio sp.]|nr:hypothetical protein [Bdellovibrio sp.]